MGKLSKEKVEKLIKIEMARAEVNFNLVNGFITDSDILSLNFVKPNFGINNINRKKEPKTAILMDIYNCPFILCDQENLSLEVKQILPAFLEYRFKMEVKQLYNYYKQGMFSKEEYNKQREMIKFCYYKSSSDGKTILETGHVKDITDNVIKCK
ncbi:MAG: hypothetical protein IJY25_02360 [Bacilli bacterium]|nr:hypothetical protein [Bacilli bacterium]